MRTVLGLLLMTFGLEEAVALLHPRVWVAGLLAEEEARRHGAGRKDAWWTAAREAAGVLRSDYGAQRVAVVGGLVREAPLHYWSELTLAVWKMPKFDYAALHAFYDRFSEPRIDLIAAERATPARQQAIAGEPVEI